MKTARDLEAFLRRHPRLALAEVDMALGSTPREQGAWMLVAPAALWGTIGGGQLEYLVIDAARALIRDGGETEHMDVPLGPAIGQCCGGRVGVRLSRLDPSSRERLLGRVESEEAAQPCVFLFGAGHVGHAMARSLSLLPLRTTVVETREDALDGLAEGVEGRLTALPEDSIRAAPAKSAFVILTHDHALDFLLAREALARTDAAYVGMIGSETKHATFRRWFREEGGSDEHFARLVCPIGGNSSRDKRPAVIAALAAAEIMTALGSVTVPNRSSAPRSA